MRAFLDVVAGLWGALRAPRVLVLVWAAITAIAIPSALACGDLARREAPRFASPTKLPADGDLFANLEVGLGASLALAALLGVFFTGGFLAYCRGGSGPPVARVFREFLGACGRSFLTNLRIAAVFAVLALLLGWGLQAFDHALRGRWLHDREPGAVVLEIGPLIVRWIHLLSAWDLARGFAFLVLVFVMKAAMAWTVASGGRSALVATGVAAWRCATQPLRVLLVVAAWTVVWAGLASVIGEATVVLLEVRGNIGLAAAVGQAGILAGIVAWLGFTIGAQRVVGTAARTVAPDAQ